jgi:6-pyruvoyl-tetrahydropterin synthase
MEDIKPSIYNAFTGVEIDENLKILIIKNIELSIKEKIDLSSLKEKLEILYSYEKNYLMLVKEFKEEIKFASSIQEDLRKERAKFFAETLKEVSETLKKSEVSSEVASKWVEELVNSYTKSLDLSSGLIEEHTIETIGKLRKDAKVSVKQSELKENA